LALAVLWGLAGPARAALVDGPDGKERPSAAGSWKSGSAAAGREWYVRLKAERPDTGAKDTNTVLGQM
jgi:hypothetical protein